MDRISGFFLLIMGWAVVVCSLAMLRGTTLGVFTVTGLAVEFLGLFLVVRTFLPTPARRDS